jgi:hypothetical protein
MTGILALAALLLLTGCRGCNHLTGSHVICGPYSSFFWLPD